MIDRTDGGGARAESPPASAIHAAWTRLAGRGRALPGLIAARGEARRARRAEERALVALGDVVAREGARPDGGVAHALLEVSSLDTSRDELRAAAAASLAHDRVEYQAVAAWMRPLVIARGLASRAILRHRLRRLRVERDTASARLGSAAIAVSLDLPVAAHPIRAAVLAARSSLAGATGREKRLLAPFGGAFLPGPARVAVGELRAFGAAAVREARAQLVPRLPALFGLAAGWWVTTTFTDSGFLAFVHSLGIGDGPRRAVSSDTYRVLRVGLPFLAAVTCSYLSARLATIVRARYGAAEATTATVPVPGRSLDARG